MQNIYLEPVGEFIQDEKWDGEYRSKNSTTVPFLNKHSIDFKLSYYDEDITDFLNDTQKLLDNFFQLTINNRNKISDYVWQNCRDFLALIDYDETDEPLHQIQNADEIWQFISLTQVQIMRNETTNQLFLILYCHCEWEQEHGLQITIREDMVVTSVAEIECYTRDDGLEIKLLEN